MTMVNRVWGFKEKAEVKATDVNPSNWDHEPVAVALKAGYISGYEDNTIRPTNHVTRQEVAVIISNLLKLDTTKDAYLSKFKDGNLLPDWSKGAFGAVVSKGFFQGYEDGSLRYDSKITRAEAIVTLDRAGSVTYDKAGTYGPATGNETVKGNVIVNAPGVTLQNMRINGNLTLGEGVGEGDVNLNNVTVNGDTFVNGGGANSIHFKDAVLVKIVVNKRTGEVRIVAEGKTSVKDVDVQSNAKIDNSKATGKGFENVTLSDRLPEGSKISLLGNFENVAINSKGTAVDVPSGSIKNLTASDKSSNTALNLGKDAKISQLVLNARLSVKGEGTIEKATVNKGAENSSFEKQPQQVEQGTGNNTNGSGAIGGGSTGNSNDSGSSDDNNNPNPVVANITFATAVNGAITVNVTAVPAVGFDIANFSVTATVYGKETLTYSVTPTELTADKEAKTVTLKVPFFTAATYEQTVVYSVSYKNKTVDAQFVVPAATPVVNEASATVNVHKQIEVTGKVSFASDVVVTVVSPNGDTFPHTTAQGVILNSDGSFTFTSGSLSPGDWGWSVRAVRDTLESTVITGSITITPDTHTNSAPVSIGGYVAATVNAPTHVFAGSDLATDADGDSLTVTKVTYDEIANIVNAWISGGKLYINPIGVGTTTVVATVYDTHNAGVDVTLHYSVEPEQNAYLSNLAVSEGILNPGFNSATFHYGVMVPNSISSITVTPTVYDAVYATIKVNSSTVQSGSASSAINLNEGNNLITINVLNGTVAKGYSIMVYRQPALSGNTDLTAISLSAGTLAPVFNANTTNYTATVSNATNSVTVTGVVYDSNSTLKVNGIYTASGYASAPISLNVGSNTVTLNVYAQNGSTKDYTVVITREAALSSNADLSDLTLSAGTLAPAFNANVNSYTASVSNATNNITVTATVYDSNSTLKINNVTVTSGAASAPISLTEGVNTVTVSVYAQNGATKDYTISVTRAVYNPVVTDTAVYVIEGNTNESVTLTGVSGFQTNPLVSVNDQTVTGAVYNTGAGTLTFTGPANEAAGSSNIVITNAEMTSTFITNGFVVLPGLKLGTFTDGTTVGEVVYSTPLADESTGGKVFLVVASSADAAVNEAVGYTGTDGANIWDATASTNSDGVASPLVTTLGGSNASVYAVWVTSAGIVEDAKLLFSGANLDS
ncbi:cadherin-like beta sandwich domain-containing protein [Paenibacillus sp. GD4]|uniref:cadherin-like beta sandwich domain-containing protein n=1 Tax=Paenibacillus sp. GD4 TaxID=3068890 RepID=UPI002796788C|nr:cadherin-like beta sandwich domain-containing protein [Paenibacillus sp. GD4]MDQ1911337.1 cadherin-like beta sandwich domain-containing protein [Paenibacillus sp. GD4]